MVKLRKWKRKNTIWKYFFSIAEGKYGRNILLRILSYYTQRNIMVRGKISFSWLTVKSPPAFSKWMSSAVPLYGYMQNFFTVAKIKCYEFISSCLPFRRYPIFVIFYLLLFILIFLEGKANMDRCDFSFY